MLPGLLLFAHKITILRYVDQPDAILHKYGFNTGHFKRIMTELDTLFKYFLTRMTKAGLTDRVNIILTADHGHAEVIAQKFGQE